MNHSEERKIRMVIVGCGNVAEKRHAPLCDASPYVELYGFFNRTREKAERFAKKYGGKVYGSLEEVLQDQMVDAILVATSEGSHWEISVAGLEAGKHVLCEKPMASSPEQCRAMIAAEEKSGKKLMINHNQRLYAPHIKAKQLIQEGAVGKVLYFRTEYSFRGHETNAEGIINKNHYDRINHVHGVLSQVGSHRIDLMNFLLEEEVDEVFLAAHTLAKTFSNGEPIPYEDQSVLNIRYKNGIVGTVENSWLDFSDNGRKTFIYGTEGTIETYAGQWGVVLHKRNGERVYYDVGRIPGHYEPPLTKIVDIFAKCVLEDTKPLCTSREGLHCLQIINAAYESQKTNTWTKVRA
ncbi:MAG: Gfo/Idh/MocA family oxidoreductase [Lachnospiraceae bacterium]|nr:Gfo/Idh/MocA family oxidoreductase [Lachnospiraceae bacterium]